LVNFIIFALLILSCFIREGAVSEVLLKWPIPELEIAALKVEDADIVKLDSSRDLKGVPGQAVPAGVQCHLQCQQEKSE
jgi:hypothetical protein